MVWWNSFLLAFSLFSRIPVPRAEWKAENMRYMLCFFPFVGAVISCAVAVLFYLSLILFLTPSVPALLLVLIPFFISGGIHLDGFCDTCDALASRAEKERKLEILKDSRCGAGAVISCAAYFTAYFALAFEFSAACVEDLRAIEVESLTGVSAIWRFAAESSLAPFASAFVLSRTLSALAAAIFPCAKTSGMLRAFSDNSARLFSAIWCVSLFAAVCAFDIRFFKAAGCFVAGASLLVFAFYFVSARRNFGGITGDTAGWFVQLCELVSLLSIVIFRCFLRRIA